ncbi:hypothetical protein [Microbispora sp. H10949]|uniref:hypothetical protein n=1 Tax=Microbispora sp. H10949 TaxID=2729111 RepID=UPI0016029547|nr:hypothetical protein [Microbispora sp. H10949]
MRSPDPLSADTILFERYLAAISETFRDPEIRDAFDGVWVTPLSVRVEMVRNAADVLAATPQEYTDYLEARRGLLEGLEELTENIRTTLKEGTLRVPLRGRSLITAAVGLGTGALGLLSGIWTGSALLTWLGTLITAVGGLGLLASRFLGSARALHCFERVRRLLVPALTEFVFSPASREVLLAALREHELAAQVRLHINELRRDRFTHAFSVSASLGLSEAFDSTYHVPTSVARDLDELLGRVSGASIGIAGPRGSGKSTLIRRFCEDPQGTTERGDLRCLVSAPVQYAPRDFVLHLFATFCRTTLRYLQRPDRTAPGRGSRVRALAGYAGCVIAYGGLAGALIGSPQTFVKLVGVLRDFFTRAAGHTAIDAVARVAGGTGVSTGWVAAGTLVVGMAHIVAIRRRRRRRKARETEATLIRKARRHLAQIRYLRTHTSGWSGTLKLPVGLDTQGTRGLSRAEQPLSYPEIVAAFRAYAQQVAAFLPGHRIFIGIDELDKLGSSAEAERFLNDVKGIFGLSHTYFMISVSDDAMSAFERRGLPFRDAFDSSFDEIIQVGPLAYEESLRLLYRRVVGLSEPYVAFCHCLSGGLPRDLIRAARRVIRAGRTLTDGVATLGPICVAIVREELRHKARAMLDAAAARPMTPEMLSLLHEVARGSGVPERTPADVLEAGLVHGPDGLAVDFLAYVYYCRTLEDVFTAGLTAERMGRTAEFDALAAARHAFAIDTRLAWCAVSGVRRRWGLGTWELPGA